MVLTEMPMHRVLADLKVGETATIERFDNPVLEAVLTDMGCPLGTQVQLYRRALFSGPLSIKTQGGNILALRLDDARQTRISKS